jgi:hypothetical protein
MKLIIAGSRTIYLFEDEVCTILNSKSIPEVTEVVCGMAYGMDQSGLDWADNYKIPVKPFPADWERYGRSAGHIRNKEMADYADALLIVWDGSSRGSKNMKENMLKLNKPIYEVILKGKNV